MCHFEIEIGDEPSCDCSAIGPRPLGASCSFAHSSYGGPLFVIDLPSAGSRLTVPRAPCRAFVKAFRSRIDACTLPERAGLDG
jgi:hypothetical protein